MKNDVISGAAFGAGIGIVTAVGVLTATATGFVSDSRMLDSLVTGLFTGALEEMLLDFGMAPAIPGFSGMIVGVVGSLSGVLHGTIEKISLLILGTIIGGAVTGVILGNIISAPARPFEETQLKRG